MEPGLGITSRSQVTHHSPSRLCSRDSVISFRNLGHPSEWQSRQLGAGVAWNLIEEMLLNDLIFRKLEGLVFGAWKKL